MSLTLRHLLVICAVLALAPLAGCGASSPQRTLEGYAGAIAERDATQAYQSLSPELRETLPIEEFTLRFEQRYMDDHATASKALLQIADQPAFVDAMLPYSEFDTLQMSLTPEGWQIENGVFNFYAQRTPRETLNSFIRAIEQRKYAVLLGFLSEEIAEYSDRESIQKQFEENPAQTQELLSRLKQNLANEIEQRGNRASMFYSNQKSVDFIKENGSWKIEDLD